MRIACYRQTQMTTVTPWHISSYSYLKNADEISQLSEVSKSLLKRALFAIRMAQSASEVAIPACTENMAC